jgi:preprotein translocase subunit SecE
MIGDYILISLAVIAVVVFAILLRRGAFLKISAYFRETQEELKKCTWPTVDELKSSTLVVVVSIALLGLFTGGVDAVITFFVTKIV